MLLLLPTGYIVGMLLWLLIVGVLLRMLLRMRQEHQAGTGRRRCANAGLSLWFLAAMLTGCELCFALFVDETDSFNMTNVSRRWFDLHIEGQRNTFGARDTLPFPKQLPPDTQRICFVGDSFTIGHGVKNREDRFSDRVGKKLKQSQGQKYIVANLGDPGLEISQIEARVHGILDAGYEMQMIVYVLCLNDIEGYDPQTAKAIGELQQAQPEFFLWTETYFFNWLYFRFVQATQPGARDYFPHLVDSYESSAWDGFAGKLGELDERCRQHDVELRLVIFPFLTQLGPSYPFLKAHKKVVEFCDRHQIPVLDLEPVFREHAGEDLRVNRFDSHPNERSHEIAAEAISQLLLGDLFRSTKSETNDGVR